MFFEEYISKWLLWKRLLDDRAYSTLHKSGFFVWVDTRFSEVYLFARNVSYFFTKTKVESWLKRKLEALLDCF